MKIARLKKSLFSAFFAAGLFTLARRLVGGFPAEGTFAGTLGLAMFLTAFWVFADAVWCRWVPRPKRDHRIDAYTAAVVEMELERKNRPPNISPESNAGSNVGPS